MQIGRGVFVWMILGVLRDLKNYENVLERTVPSAVDRDRVLIQFGLKYVMARYLLWITIAEPVLPKHPYHKHGRFWSGAYGMP